MNGAPTPSPSFEARLFAPRLPESGEPVRATLRAHALMIAHAGGREDDVGRSALRQRVGGWRGTTLFLEWDAPEGVHALEIDDPAAIAAVQAALGSQQRGTTRIETRRVPRSWMWIGIAILGTAAALTLLVLFASQRVVDVAVRRIPVEWEAKLGDAAAAQFLLGAKRVESGDAVDAVREIGARLAAAADAPYRFRWTVVRDARVNAFALPGGQVVVFTGLLHAAQSAEEVAGVLAHEVQHVVLRHSLRGMVRGLGLNAAARIAFGGAGDLGGHVGTLVQQLGSLRFSRADETQADVEGLALLERAGIRGDGLATFFDRLAREPAPPAFLSTHPASAERARRVRELLAGAPAAQPLALDWERVREDAAPERDLQR